MLLNGLGYTNIVFEARVTPLMDAQAETSCVKAKLALQPLVSVPVRTYDVVTDGETIMVVALQPGFQV